MLFPTLISAHAPQLSVPDRSVGGVCCTGVPGEEITLTPGIVFFIGAAFVKWLKEKKADQDAPTRVAVGCDPRLSGPLLRPSLAAGLCSGGATMADFGLASTPAMFMSTVATGYHFDGAIIVTASHLPFNRNGLKFFTADGGLGKPDIAEILLAAAQLCSVANVKPCKQSPPVRIDWSA